MNEGFESTRMSLACSQETGVTSGTKGENEWQVTVGSKVGQREATERQAEMIRWEEWGAPWRQLHSEVANPCFPQLGSEAGVNTTKKSEPKKPQFHHRTGLQLFLLSDPQYPCACWAVDSSAFVWLLILGVLTYCHSPCHDSYLVGSEPDSLTHLRQPPSPRT